MLLMMLCICMGIEGSRSGNNGSMIKGTVESYLQYREKSSEGKYL